MAYASDLELQDMTADTAPASGDLIIIVVDPSGTPVARKMTVDNLFAGIEDALSELATRPAQSDTLLLIDGGVAKYVQKRNLQVRYVAMPIGASGTDLAVGDRQAWFKVTSDIAGLDVVSVEADVGTAPTGSGLTFQLRNVTQAADILSTALTIDATETSSDTAATPAVINTAEDDLTDGDIIAVDIDAVGSSTAGEDALITVGLA